MFRKSQQAGAESTVRVAVRFRPMTEEESHDPPAFMVRSDGAIVDSSDLAYSFELDRAFGSEVSQAEVYNEIGRPAVLDILNGYNGTVLAYGQTGSGKTYCMFGPNLDWSSQLGLIPRAARQVFDAIRSGVDDVSFVLRCSLLEVYCEQLRDLLDPSNHDLRIHETPQRGVFVDGLTQECVTCEEDVFDILRLGEQMRIVASTKLNQLSSRSHVIFFLACEQRLPDGSEKVGRLSLADLAGSERVEKSGALLAGGARLQEATKINSALTALGHVIQALVKKQVHVPYRNSQLTRVLQETLGGNCKTALVVACSPAARHEAETLSTLRFATRARLVCNHVKVNLIRSPEQLSQLVAHLQRDLANVRKEANRLGVEIGLNETVQEIPWLAPVVEAETGTGGNSSCEDLPTDGNSAARASHSAPSHSNAQCGGNGEDTLKLDAAKAEVDDLERALERQDEELKDLLEEAVPPEVKDVFHFLGRCAWLRSYSWRMAASQLKERDTAERLAEAEAEVAEREESLAVACERRRQQRWLLRRQEAEAPMNNTTVIGDVSVLAPDLACESMDRSGLLCSGAKPPRPWRSYLSAGGRRNSKVLRPISRRSIERRSLSGTASPSASSPSATPRASPRGNCSGPHSPSPARECTNCNSPDGAAASRNADPLSADQADSWRLPGHSTFLQLQGLQPSRRSRVSAPDYVDMANVLGEDKVDVMDGGPGISGKTEDLRQQIHRLRAEQDRRRVEFEEQRRQKQKEFCGQQAKVLQHLALLEEDRCSSAHSAIPQLRHELEQLDYAVMEAEAEEDAASLELMRLCCQQAHVSQQLSIGREVDAVAGKPGELLQLNAQDFDAVYTEVSATINQFSLALDNYSVLRSPGSSARPTRNSLVAGLSGISSCAESGKENDPPLRWTSLEAKGCSNPYIAPSRRSQATVF